ncbi:S41 family peptidase [Maribacter ulvicola]|nr:S41 family peptidase [Maribacter ulvicola]
MKKTIFLLIIFFCGNNLFAQNELTETEKLATTAKVWGFLKYYHPEVADGKYDWDEELFKILPKVKDSQDKEQLSKVYLNWVNGLGQIKPCKSCDKNKKHEYFDMNFDLNWLNNSQIFTPELSKKLRHIEVNRHQGKKHYVKHYSRRLKIADFTNENDYENFDWQDENFRLLSLFRYWNMIEYFFPAKYQTDMDWDDVLEKMIPKFSHSKSEIDFHLAMVELASSIDDSHVRLNTQKTYLHFGHFYLPIKFRLIEGKAIVTEYYNDSLAKLNDLRIGDVITKANGKKIETIFQEEKKYIMGSNSARKMLNASYYILNGPTDSLKLEVMRGSKTLIKPVKRYLYRDFKYKKEENGNISYKILKDDIGYIKMDKLKNTEVAEIFDALKDSKAIIFDTRQSSTASIYQLSNYITSPRKDFYKAIEPDLDYPGKFIWTNVRNVGNREELRYKGQIVLLVDEGCQSQCEFTIMCLQTGNNVTTIGTQSSGANGNVIRFNMVGGFKTQISGVGIFYPDGTENQRKGVKIDIEVKPTVKGTIERKDEILEKAIEFINN